MNFYLAARMSRGPEMLQYSHILKRKGHVVTSRWIQGGHAIPDDGISANGGMSDDIAQVFAQEDIDDLVAADCVIHFTEKPGTPGRNRGGRHVEFGFAQAAGMIQIIVGPRENIFHYLPGVAAFETFTDFLDSLHYTTGMSVVTESLGYGEGMLNAKSA